MEPFTLILTIITACICVYYFVLSKQSHFERLKIPHERPVPILGNMAPYLLRRTSIVENLQRIYNLFPDAKYFGFYDFMRPTYVIRDPDLIAAMAITHFDNFCDHLNFVNEKVDKLAGKNLFGLRGEHWREMRKLLSPSFTSSKMKMMFGLICQCADNFSNFIATESGKIGKTYKVKDILRRYGNDVVATCAFGIDVDSFKYPENEFYMFGKETINFDSKMAMKYFINRNLPAIAEFFNLRMFSEKLEDFFKGVISETVKIRDEKGIVRPDMIQLLMESRDKINGPKFNIDDITAQAFVFFVGGFDTVSTAMCFMVHEIGVNPDIQKKLKDEVDTVLKVTNSKPTYDAINGMKYLDAVVNESLRLYPVGAFVDRLCVKEFELPPATPDGKPVTIKPGESVWFPNYSLQHDSKYYSQPEKFDPDRFLNGEVNNSVYMPFGVGPRMCIGYRFVLMEAKVMLFHLLWRCDLEPDIKTKVPVVLDKKSLDMMPEGGFWMKFRVRKSKAAVDPLFIQRN